MSDDSAVHEEVRSVIRVTPSIPARYEEYMERVAYNTIMNLEGRPQPVLGMFLYVWDAHSECYLYSTVDAGMRWPVPELKNKYTTFSYPVFVRYR